jgi:uncharacterized protein (TIGR02001 family)
MGAYSIGMKRFALLLALCWSGASLAGTTANVGAVSEYLLRGIEGSHGIAVQGGLDWTGEPGVYVGTWASSLGGPGKVGDFELDLYGGWAGKLGAVAVDVGVVYYAYPDDERNPDYDYPEVYLELGVGVLALQLYYATDLYGDANEAAADLAGKDNDGIYVNAVATFPLSPTLNLGLQLGHSSGDGVEVAYGDRYADYGISLTQAFSGGVALSLGVYDQTLVADDPKPVVGVKKVFDL